jgi:glycosyltransferase involved in cell wall biosynthesis
MLVMDSVGIVVIGRNEGNRLEACFSSLRDLQTSIVYVDSGSSDNSVSIAKNFTDQIIELDSSTPFSAARARNEGYEMLMEWHPRIKYIQFIDGDCTLSPGWINAAAHELDNDPRLAAVTGSLLEKNPNYSIYNRLCAMEWKSPAGEITYFGAFGGISMIRGSVLQETGGFNPAVIAGEEPELAARMSKAGYKIRKLDHAMAIHDANIMYFSQWWKRAVREGHSMGQRVQLGENTSILNHLKEQKSVWFWGLFLPVFIFATLLPTNGWSSCLLVGYALLAYRIFQYSRNQGDSFQDAILYARFIVLGKFANVIGLLKFFRRRKGQRFSIIEYK